MNMVSIYLTIAVISSIALDDTGVLKLRSDEAQQDINANISTWMGNVVSYSHRPCESPTRTARDLQTHQAIP